MEKKKILIIVDPQVDFISGSLATQNGATAMDNLCRYLGENAIDLYDEIVLTADLHPHDHCSFEEFGGPFPVHCVLGTTGCEVYPELYSMLEMLHQAGVPSRLLPKGTVKGKEEFSVFKNQYSGEILRDLISEMKPDIDICGIATDYCVYETVKDLHESFPELSIRILKDYCAAVDEFDDKLDNYVLGNKNISIIPDYDWDE